MHDTVYKVLFLPFRNLYPQSCVSSGGSMVGLMVTSSKRTYAIPKSAASRAPASHQSTAQPYLLRRHSNTVLSQSLLGSLLLVHMRFVWALWTSLVDMGFDSKHDFAPPTILLGLLLCPWTWGISSQLLQCHAGTTLAPIFIQANLNMKSCGWRVQVSSWVDVLEMWAGGTDLGVTLGHCLDLSWQL